MGSSDFGDSVRAIVWDGEALKLLDQRLLPGQQAFVKVASVPECAEAIANMVVRGAPAIGITGAYGCVLAARQRVQPGARDWRVALEGDFAQIERARPTAVNLSWAVQRMRKIVESTEEGELLQALRHEAARIHEDDIAANRAMGQLGADRIAPGSGVLTHCNTGSLATGGYGTALGVIRAGVAAGRIRAVFADETRPWLQGARLTLWELMQDGIPATLLCEGAAASLMRSGKVQWVIVGADRIAANGDTANKIGTYGLAVLARHHGVRFMVVAPFSTVDLAAPSGDAIPIEERSGAEITRFAGALVAPEGAQAWNPAFDVTPAGLIDCIVTERGVVQAPYQAGLASLAPPRV